MEALRHMRQPNLFMSLKMDHVMVSLPSYLLVKCYGLFFFFFFFSTWDSLVILVQAIQEVYVVEEWVKDTQNEARAEANLRAKTNKALGAMKHENQELVSKLTAKERARRSADARLKNVRDQAEDQRKKLYLTEIELATQMQLVLDLKAELEKTKSRCSDD